MILESVSSVFYLFSLDKNEDKKLILFLGNTIIIQIIFNGLISFPILKYPLYRHHLFSIILLLVSFVLVSLNVFSAVSRDPLLYIFFGNLCWAFQETNAKWIMKEFCITPYFLLLLYGVIGSIYQMVISVPLYYIPCKMDFCGIGSKSIEDYKSTFTKIFTLGDLKVYIWLSSIVYVIYKLFLLLVNNAFNPTHSCSAESIETLILWIVDHLEQNYVCFCISLLGYCILVIGGMIYNELIICYCCNLHKYTKYEIRKRASRDMKLSSEIELTDLNLDFD